MRTPRKLYLIVSRSYRCPDRANRFKCMCWHAVDVFRTLREAAQAVEDRNATHHLGATDWRVETFVKGD